MYQIASTGTAYDAAPGGRIDVDSSGKQDNWFICSSQSYTDTAAVSSVYLSSIVIINGVAGSSDRHEYNNYAKCLSTVALSATEAVFILLEPNEGSGDDVPYTKFVQINFRTGDYLIQKQIDPFSTLPFNTAKYN